MVFFFNDTATTEIYTLSLHDALPIFPGHGRRCYLIGRHGTNSRDEPRKRRSASSAAARTRSGAVPPKLVRLATELSTVRDRKSTRLNSSHANISYAVFCLKKKQLTLH